MFPEVDPVLGPEMRSTGEVLGLADTFGEAYFKAQEATKTSLPLEGTVLISVNNADKGEVAEVARDLINAGFKLMATGNTYKTIIDAGYQARKVNKMSEGRPNLYDVITNKEVQLVINTPGGKEIVTDDSYVRKAAIKARVPYITTMAAAKAAVKGILTIQNNNKKSNVASLQELHKKIK